MSKKKTSDDADASSAPIEVTLGIPWFTLWLFTLAFAHLSFGQGVLSILVWPYYLGAALAK